MISNSASFYRRYWIVLLLRATTFSGVATVPSDLFHRLVYFVNALMPAVGLESETARVLKASYGPFFPDYQWDLDRLVGISLVDVVNFEFQPGDSTFFGQYSISRFGVKYAEKIAMSSEFFSDVERAISEIVSAFVSTPGALSSVAPNVDANFGQDTILPGSIIDFGEWNDENYSTDAAMFLYNKWLIKLRLQSARGTGTEVPELADWGRQAYENYSDSHLKVAGIGQEANAIWQPLTSSRPNRRSFHLYAHYLVKSLVQVSTESGRKLANE